MTDPLLERLAELPKPDVDALTAERIRRRARAELLTEASRPGWVRSLSRVWTDVLEPVAVGAVVVVYAAWALSTAGSLVSGTEMKTASIERGTSALASRSQP